MRVIDSRVERPPPKPTSRVAWLLGGLVIGLLVGVAFSPSFGPGGGPVIEPESGEGLPIAPSLADAIVPLEARIPHFAGSLLATVGVDDFELLIWSDDRAVPERLNIGDAVSPAGLLAPPVTWDASASTFAFLRNLDESETVLYVGSEAEYVPTVRGVTWFAWHTTEPNRLAWTVAIDGGVEQQLFVLDAAGSTLSAPVPSFTLGADEQLLAWDEMGFILGFWEDALSGVWVRRVDDTGREIGRAPGTLVAARYNGELLLSRREYRGLTFHLADPTLAAVTDLEWAPVEASGQVKPASWATDGRFAFITVENRVNQWRLEIFRPDGEPLVVREIAGRIWDVAWSPDGRFVVMPGFDNEDDQGHLVFVYDTVDDSMYQIEFDARVAAISIRPWRPASQ